MIGNHLDLGLVWLVLLILLLLVIAAYVRLGRRHIQLKVTLNRVANERDAARWELARRDQAGGQP